MRFVLRLSRKGRTWPGFVLKGTNPAKLEALCLFRQRVVARQSLHMLVCKCVCVPVSLCVCFVIGRQWEQVQRFTCRHLLIPSSISETPGAASLFLRPPVYQSQASRGHDTLPSARTHKHSHRLQSELSTTFLHTFPRAVCLPALPLRVFKGFLGITCVPRRQVNSANVREKSKLYFFC